MKTIAALFYGIVALASLAWCSFVGYLIIHFAIKYW